MASTIYPCLLNYIYIKFKLVYTNIDQTLVNSLHRLLSCEIGGLDRHVITFPLYTHVTPIL